MEHIGISREESNRIAAIIAELDGAPAGRAIDKRIRPRIDYAHPMWLCVPEGVVQSWAHVHSRNLSTGGLAFLTRKNFDVGKHLVVSHTMGEAVPQLVFACVRFSRQVDSDISEAGVEFLAALPDPRQERLIPAEWIAYTLKESWVQKYPVFINQ